MRLVEVGALTEGFTVISKKPELGKWELSGK